MDGKTALGASSPANPALHMPEPLSTTRAATSSSHMLMCGCWLGRLTRSTSVWAPSLADEESGAEVRDLDAYIPAGPSSQSFLEILCAQNPYLARLVWRCT